ncbi:hypothetical protein AAZV13_06G103200 [Glycine max]
MDATVTQLSPSCNAAEPPRRIVRRRLVQTTLFPHKPPEPVEKNDKEDERHEDYSDAENHKKRKKPKAKTTPRKKASKNATPKKNASANGTNKGSTSRQVLADYDPVNATEHDLFLEAKLAAEEDSRIFAGRQIHPFFSLWKAGKKVQDMADSGSNLSTTKSEEERTTCGPIHVFENTQDDTPSLDWRNWAFLENTTTMNYGPEILNSSVLEGSVESLNFDKLRSSLDPSGVSISQNALSSDRLCIHPENLEEVSPSDSASLAEKTCPPTCEDAKQDLEVDESVTTTVQAGIFRKSDTEPPSRFLQESMRSYYRSCVDKAENSLWTYKYKPTKAVEVCGNDESVNFLRDWLHLWHERRYKSRKDISDMDKSDMRDVDDDYKCSCSDYDSEDINEEDSLQNVLLITGPIGSGKSAAVYACAEEQRFEILELNASDCRNGTAVRNYFGDTLGSLGFKRASEITSSSQKKTTKLSPASALQSGKAADEVNDGVNELITISDDEAHIPSGSSQKLLGKNNVVASCDKVQTLILIEDVDILSPEDRGCIAAIQQIAETAKGPIILTSVNPGLPGNFDVLHVSFMLPSPQELLCHLYTVCLTEGVNIHPLLLEKFIHSCDGDIRKSIMHLQFWFQSKRFQKDVMTQTCYGSLPFDLELGHQILPKIMPWDFPSEISELIENEIAKLTNIMEENSRGLVTEELLPINEQQNDLNVQCMEADYIEAKKVEMIKRNGSLTDYSELEIQYNAISEFSNSSGSPLTSSRHNGRRKLVVMSSDSEDEDSNNGYPVDTHEEANTRQSMKENNGYPSELQLNGNYPSTSVRKLLCSELEHSEEEHFKYSETTDDTYVNETCKSLDVSCVPESTFVPETEIENGTESMYEAVSSGPLFGPQEVSVYNELKPFTFSVPRHLTKLSQNLDLLDTEISDHSCKGVQQDVLDEHMETIVNVMDECSRVDFKLKPTCLQSNSFAETEKIQKLWGDLLECRMDLRQHATSEQLGAFQVVRLASGLNNLISEADLFHERDIMEPSAFLSGETTSIRYHEQIMTSTIAEHGFCFYAKLIADEASKLGCANCVDITSEMLASTIKLTGQDLARSKVIYTGKQVEWNSPINNTQKSENKTSQFEAIQSIVPARIYLALKGDVFNEYLSSLRQISRAEASRSSQGVEKKRRGRVRGFHHYLNRCTTLSPEDISLVSEGNLYRKNSTQHTT